MTFIIAITIIIAGIIIFMMHPKFGDQPKGERLNRIKQSPNFRDGQFQNIEITPQLAEGETFFKVLKKFFFEKKIRNKPSKPLPSVKTDLKNLSLDENVLVWFGHSSYFMQIDGKKILVDPVLSGAASPVAFTTRSYPGSDMYSPEDFPEIDYLFITHDHWDHLDYETVLALKPKIKNVITGLGNGSHFGRWEFNPEIVIEKDWNETIELGEGFTAYTTTARHFAGRSIKRNNTLWVAFLLQTPKRKIFIGGDSGYGKHFKEIGERFGKIDLAILECGQYDQSWKYIHMLPHEITTAAIDLNAKMVFPVHWGKFSLANHAWDEPPTIAVAAVKKAGLRVLTPMIGQKVNLDNPGVLENWWESVDSETQTTEI